MNIETTESELIIHGILYHKNSDLVNIGCLVRVHSVIAPFKEIGRAVTDINGEYKIVIPISSVTEATYQVRFYGSGYIQKLAPEGDWHNFTVNTAKKAFGEGLVFRGIYDSSKTYYSDDGRKDVVLYRADTEFHYYYCLVDETTGVWNVNNWALFEKEYESVAADLFLAKDATITRGLVMGTYDEYFGFIRSANAESLLVGDGFYMAEESGGVFRVGTVADNKLLLGILFDGENLVEYADGAGITTLDENIRIFAGASPENIDAAPFRVTKYGKLYSRGGIIDGEAIVPYYRTSYNGTDNTPEYFLEDFKKSGATEAFIDSYTSSPYERNINTGWGIWTTNTIAGDNAPLGHLYYYSKTSVSTDKGRAFSGELNLYIGNTDVLYWQENNGASVKFVECLRSSILNFSNVDFPTLTSIGYSGTEEEQLYPTLEIGFNVRFNNGADYVAGIYYTKPSIQIKLTKIDLTTGVEVPDSAIYSPIYTYASTSGNQFVAKMTVESLWLKESVTNNQGIVVSLLTSPFYKIFEPYLYLVTGIPIDRMPKINIGGFFIKRPLYINDFLASSVRITGKVIIDGDLIVEGETVSVSSSETSGDFTISGDLLVYGTSTFKQSAHFESDVQVDGSIFATVKHFLIPDKMNEGKQIQYTSVEAPENSIIFRGRVYSLYDKRQIITLPEEWGWLIDKKTVDIFINNNDIKASYYEKYNIIELEGTPPFKCSFLAIAERADIPKLKVRV